MKATPPALALLAAGCTTLGPMPTTTAVSAVPAARPGGEVQGAVLPVFRLSDAARGEDRNGDAVAAIAALFEPDRVLELPGVIVGGRVFGEGSDTGIEPMLGYRKQYGQVALAGVGFGTRMSATENGADYGATRFGGEAIADVALAELAEWFAIHVGASVQATYIKATGRYCLDEATGNGLDCAEDGSVPFVDGALDGVYPAATLHASLDFFRSPRSVFHGARLGGMFSAGHMPRLINGRQQWGDRFIAGGVSLTLGFGAKE